MDRSVALPSRRCSSLSSVTSPPPSFSSRDAETGDTASHPPVARAVEAPPPPPARSPHVDVSRMARPNSSRRSPVAAPPADSAVVVGGDSASRSAGHCRCASGCGFASGSSHDRCGSCAGVCAAAVVRDRERAPTEENAKPRAGGLLLATHRGSFVGRDSFSFSGYSPFLLLIANAEVRRWDVMVPGRGVASWVQLARRRVAISEGRRGCRVSDRELVFFWEN
eukprot:COSAG06_NODE_23089_length_703_cov_0.854305_1_plen_222_part_10